jgi:hypothetical protein
MTTILVGAEQKKFVVHQALLCDKSQYFAKALTGSFEEGKTGIVKLKDVSSVLFKIVVSWLYCGKIVDADDGSNIAQDFAGFKHKKKTYRVEVNANDTSTWPKQLLIELYILADRLDIKELRNNTIDGLTNAVEQSERNMKPSSYRFIDSNTTAESPLRKFAVHILAYNAQHGVADQTFWLSVPQEMAVTALLIWGQRVPLTLCNSCYQDGLSQNEVKSDDDHPCKYEDKTPLEVDMCVYHEHADDEERKACQISRDKTVNRVSTRKVQ